MLACCCMVAVMDDALDELLQAIQAGDPDARRELGRWLNVHLRRIFIRRFGRLNTDELVQRTALDLLSSLHDGPVDAEKFMDRVESYAGTERREWITGRQRERDRARWRAEHAHALRPVQLLDEQIADQQKLARLYELIGELAPSQRRVLLARLAGYRYDTIAAALGIATGTARKYASEGKQIVIGRWEDERTTPPPFRTPGRVS